MKEVIGLGKLVLILIQKVWIQPQYQQQKQPEQPQPQLPPQLQLAKNQHQQLRVPTQVGPTQVKSFTPQKIVNIFCHCAFIIHFLANSSLIMQKSHAKTFKMRDTRCMYNNI